MNRVDVIVPCYKYGRYLRTCVRSVLEQQGVAVRVLILDDCSPDETPQVGRALAAEDARVEYRRHERNRGHIATYNEGLDWACGDQTLLLSADDVLTPCALDRAVTVMNEHPEVGFIYGKRILLDGDAGVPWDAPHSTEVWGAEILSGVEFLGMVCGLQSNPVCTPTAVVRGSVQKAVGYYRAELPHTGDLEMWLRCAMHGAVGRLDSDQAYWRQHPQNMRWDYHGPNDFRQHKAAFESVFVEYGRLIANLDGLRRTVSARLSEEAFWRANDCFEKGMPGLCDEYLQAAAECDAGIRSSRSWRRLQVKRAVGPRVWSWVSRARHLKGGRRPLVPGGAQVGEPQLGRWMA